MAGIRGEGEMGGKNKIIEFGMKREFGWRNKRRERDREVWGR